MIYAERLNHSVQLVANSLGTDSTTSPLHVSLSGEKWRYSMGKFIDLTGQTFGRWKVIEFAEMRRNSANSSLAFWLCECQCDAKTRKIISSNSLRSGNSKSCGCLKKEILVKRSTTHGFARRGKNGTSIYHVWHEMKARCFNPRCKSYKNYGGRNITMCDEWKNSFTAFKDWAYKNGYKVGLTIDRIDNNGNYEPQNCRWVNDKVQSNNKRSNRYIEYNGETKTIAEWCEQLGVKSHIVYSRIDNYGWNPLTALLAPKQHNRPIICYTSDGYEREFPNVKTAASSINVTQGAIRNAVQRHHRCKGYYWKFKYDTIKDKGA